MKTVVYVTTQFVGFHRWEAAPQVVAYLRDWHRHVFHVKLAVSVDHLDRQVEFILLKQSVQQFIFKRWENQRFEASCEMIAASLVQEFGAEWADVSEDGENGAIVHNSNAHRRRGKCFIGIEAEGPLRGTPTLFVPGSCTPERLASVVKRLSNARWMPKALYLGAGNERLIGPKLLAYVANTWDSFAASTYGSGDGVLTVEENTVSQGVALLKSRLKDRMIVVSLSRETSFPYDYFKAVYNESVAWYKGDQHTTELTTDLNDPLFAQDILVE